MRSVFKCVKGFNGDNIILNARVEYKRFEDIKDFKKRVKKHKYYSEDYILEDLYTYMSYSDDLLNLIDKQQKEIEELKENELLEITENFISKDKIRELKEKVEKEMISNPYDFSYMINKLLEEKYK